MKVAIFGAKSIALGVYYALQMLYNEYHVDKFLVSSLSDNPHELAGIPVMESRFYTDKDACILIATPENVHKEIKAILQNQGFHNLVCIDSCKEADLMEKYYTKLGLFPSVHLL